MAGWLVFEGVGVTLESDFEQLFRSQFERLVALGVAMTGNMEIARDLAQETMARAFRHWDTVSAADSREAWLRRVMTNLLIDRARRSRVESSATQRLAARPPGSAEQAPVSRMAELLRVLPERQRAVVVLYYVDDLPISGIADTLGIATGTVKALLWKARRTLERHLVTEVRHG
jgi:RNA polymerase sigma-70 factor, ECF subfamily